MHTPPQPTRFNERNGQNEEEKYVFRHSVLAEVGSSAMILLRNCSARWERSARPVINDVDLNVQQGSFVVVIGPVGSGKSSLFAHYSGRDTPYIGNSYRTKCGSGILQSDSMAD